MFNDENNRMGIGADIEDVSRFEGLSREKDARFLHKIFTEKELEYCFSAENPAQHLAARYAAKEAVVKALSSLGRDKVYYRDIEVTSGSRGIPGGAVMKGGFENIIIKLSLSHTRELAIAFALVLLRPEE